MADSKPAEAAEDQAAIEEAVTPDPDGPDGRSGIHEARDAELARQAAQAKAVAKANKSELPKLGGDLLDPGLGR